MWLSLRERILLELILLEHPRLLERGGRLVSSTRQPKGSQEAPSLPSPFPVLLGHGSDPNPSPSKSPWKLDSQLPSKPSSALDRRLPS